MDYHVTKEALAVCETVFDGVQEQPVDLDFTLPDYCPDIQRILKCQVYPRIHSRSISGDRLEIEGNVTVKLLYLDEDRAAVRCCEHTESFSASLNLKKSPQNAVALTKTQVEYVNCRAVSPRKLDIHGAFSICARVLSRVEQDIVCSIPGDDIQQKVKPVQTGSVTGISQQQFTVSEVLEIGQGKPEAESIVRTDVCAVMEDYKAIANKVILKGNILIKTLYAGNMDSGELETMEYTIPVSQIVDVEGIDDGGLCEAHLDILSASLQIRSDSDGQDSLLEADIRLTATVIAYAQTTLNLVTDAYSTCYDLQLEYEQIRLESMTGALHDNYVCKNTVEVGEAGISRVIDAWNEIRSATAQVEGGQLIYKGKFNICILALNQEEEPVYLEKMFDFTYAREWSEAIGNLRCEAEAAMLSISYRLLGGTGIEIRAELGLQAFVFRSETCQVVAAASADETKPRSRDESASLIIYYADAGEKIWNIARDYCTSAEAILQENNLTEEVLENRQMLLIPV